MKKEISGVLPVGAPWGGPESIRFVSCSSSLYMHLKQPNEFEDELYCNRSEKLCDRCGRCRDYDWHRKMHEQVYHELLTLSGLNCRTVWDPEFRPELLTDLLRTARDDEAIARTMAFAGFEYRLVEGLPADRMRSLVVQSIDRGTPVPAFQVAGDDWCLITGYDADGARVTGYFVPQPWDSGEGRAEELGEHAFSKRDWLRPGTRLVLVGDADQLPSVGAGNVFSDLIRSGRVETVFLREVFRQAEQSAIIRNAHAVNLGQPPQLANNQGDFFFLCRRDGERTLSTVVELCKTRLPDHMGIPADQIQVLTPTRKGPSGTENLNRCLQAALNPPAADKREIQWGERLFRTGDRIMQTKNNYNVVWEKADGTVGTGMFNGDVGRIVEIDPSGELLVVNFDDRIATYTLDMLNEIDLAYAMTVHKAQGSEYQCVVLAAMPAAPSLMVRGVLYTALTRARELLIVVGDDAAIRAMAANDRQQRRYSGLRWRLAHFADPAER